MADPTKPPPNWNFLDENSLGGDSAWITPVAGSRTIYDRNWMTNYTITFTTDCNRPVVLTFSGTGYLRVFINGSLLQDWVTPYPELQAIQFKPYCGCNVLTINLYNCFYGSPAAIIYTLDQDQTDCYSCPNSPVAYYNRDTCQCECVSSGGSCSNPAVRYYDYPICGCVCSPQHNDSYCPNGQYWNNKTCACKCPKKCCDPGYTQNPNNCNCEASCVQNTPCLPGFEWNTTLCKCVSHCKNIISCSST